VTVKHWCIASTDLTGVIQNDDLVDTSHVYSCKRKRDERRSYLSDEASCLLSRIVLDIRGNEATTKFFHTDVLDVEANVVTWHGFCKDIDTCDDSREGERRTKRRTFESFVMHFDGLDFSLQVRW
jgi:hypothetical protein